MSNHKIKNRNAERSEINISPLIDMVFILLIFFIVTTVFVEEAGLSADTPGIIPPTTEIDNSSVTFTISDNGRIYIEGVEIGFGGVRTAVLNRMQGKLRPMTVAVEPDAPSGIMVRVMDEVRRARPDVEISLSEAG
jgi:biopolymer transport protein ExbD